MVVSVWALLIIGLVTFAGALLQRVSGMGLGLMGAPVLSLLLGPVAGVLVINVLAAFNAVFQTASVRDDVDWRKFRRIAPFLIIGSLPAAWLVHSTPTGPLQVLVGALVLLGLLVTTYMPNQHRFDGAIHQIGAGAAGGFMNTLAGIAGPAITVYAQASRWPQRSYQATLQPLFLVAGLVSLLVKEIGAETPIVTTAPWHLWAVGCGAMLVGLWAGNRLADRIPTTKARALAVGVATTGSLVTLVRGGLSML